MVDVFLDPRLPEYFVEQDWNDVRNDDHSARSIMTNFLSEKITVVYGANISELDFEFLGSVKLPQIWQMKKFQFTTLLSNIDNGVEDDLQTLILEREFSGDVGRFNYFIEQLRQMRGIVDGLLKRIFHQIWVDNLILVARFSETRMENLHYDLDAGSDSEEAFRLYINLDQAPRIWATSYQMTQLIERGGARLTSGIDETLPAETILKRLTTRAFGGWHQRATERISPRHLVFFDPGDIWIVDGRSVSHQVLTGHRVLTIYARIPHAANPDLRPTFAEKLRRSFDAARQMRPGTETALINYYRPEEIAGAANMKEDWAMVFGDTRTGRVRKFDANGLVQASGSLAEPGSR